MGLVPRKEGNKVGDKVRVASEEATGSGGGTHIHLAVGRRGCGQEEEGGATSHPVPSLSPDQDSVGSQLPLPPGLPPGHYDSPKNSHIPGHYDLPPVRHPPSPPLRRQDR